MKIAILILIIANLVLFAWLHWTDTPEQQAQLMPISRSGERIALASEASALPALPAASTHAVSQITSASAAATAATATAATVSGPASQSHPRCLIWGPVSTTIAARLVAQVNTGGKLLEAFDRVRQVAVAYRVELSGFPDEAAARRAASAIRRGGVKDLFLRLDEDAQSPVLSLGVFRELNHARHRAARVRTLGFRPDIHTIKRGSTNHYLQAHLPIAASVVTALRAQGVRGKPRPATCAMAPAASSASAPMSTP